jgi:hypothetical protein
VLRKWAVRMEPPQWSRQNGAVGTKQSTARTWLGRWRRHACGLPDELFESFRTSLQQEAPGASSAVLAWAATADGACVATLSQLSHGRPGDWRHIGWHEIERGGWSADDSTLSWRLYDGTRGAAELSRPGRMPAVFRERVTASIVVETRVPVAERAAVTVVARREPGRPGSPLVWHGTVPRGSRLPGDNSAELVEWAVSQARAEYDID